MAAKGRCNSPERCRTEVRFRRDLVIAGRSGEGPFTIRFADVRYRALSPSHIRAAATHYLPLDRRVELIVEPEKKP